MISVIISSRNRASLLWAALRSLTSQSADPESFEVVVIDNGSKDDTVEVVNRSRLESKNIRYFYEAEPGLHAGRHRGMMEARGDVLVFADDDIEALPSWLASLQDAFGDPEVVMVGGNNLPMFLGTPPGWLSALWQRPTGYGGHALPCLSLLELSGGIRRISPYLVWGCNLAIRKGTLLEAGGFHPDGMPTELLRFRGDGETHVSRHVAETGLKCLFHPGASVYHKVTSDRMTRRYLQQRGFAQGISDSFAALRRGLVDEPVKLASHRRAVRWGIRRLTAAMSLVSTSAAARSALDEMAGGYREGYAFHQNAYRTDPEVRAWVHRERFF